MTPRNQFMIIGAVVGALLGALAAYAYVESQQTGGLLAKRHENGREVMVKAGFADYLKIGTAVYGLVRQLQGMIKQI